jgi:small conductance mechanosensitive channel
MKNDGFMNWADILTNKLAGWWDKAVDLMPNIILALIVIICFFFLGKFFRRTAYKISVKLSRKSSVSGLFSSVAYMLILMIGLFIALDILQLNKALSSLLAGAGIIGLVLGFAFQDLSANFISGIYIAFKKPFEVGQTIETNGYMGNIEEIQLRTTIIRTFQGLHLMIPNKDIFQKPMINYSRSEERRMELAFNISVEYDIRKISSLAISAVEKLDYIVKERPVEFYYTGFGENYVRVAVWFWIYNHKPPGFMVAQNDAIVNIISALAEQGISLVIPVSIQEKNKKTISDLIENK